MRVKAKGSALCPVYAAIGATPRRYLGRAWNGETWASTGEVVEVHDHFAEYRAAVSDGSLWAADEDTAARCGVEFDPNFGGE